MTSLHVDTTARRYGRSVSPTESYIGFLTFAISVKTIEENVTKL